MIHKGISVSVQPQVGVLLSAMLLLLPLRWILSWLVAAVIHELCHALAIGLCGKRIYAVQISASGAILRADALTLHQSIICSLAGPLGGFVITLFASVFPRIAVCALVQSLFNLLPIRPLDGNKVLHGISNLLFREQVAERVITVVEWLTLATVSVLGLYIAFSWKLGLLPVAAVAGLVLRNTKIKIPCKDAPNRVQ